MTTSQRPGQAETGSRVRHTLDGSLGALRHLNDERIGFWECFWRFRPRAAARPAGSSPRGRAARPGRAPRPPFPACVGRGDEAA